jgi:hypothetical protein
MKVIKTVLALQGECNLLLFRLKDGTVLMALCKEKKKHFALYTPMKVTMGVTDEGKNTASLAPWFPSLMVESSNTVVRKKDVQIFEPSEQFQGYYLKKLTSSPSNESSPKKKDSKKSDGNVIEFTKFKKAQGANLSLVMANTQGEDPQGAA